MVAWLLLVPGCAAGPADVTPSVTVGEYGRARQEIAAHLARDRSDRMYLLDRMRLGMMTLADGYPEAAQTTFEEVYSVLRTQGINADKTVASVVLWEGVKFWKGEPFEQALGFLYYSLQQASLGQWDNARAAAGNALFQLRDFGSDRKGRRLDVQGILDRAVEHERAAKAGAGPTAPTPPKDYLNSGYAVRDSNFALGFLLNGLANQQLGRQQEAHDNYAVAGQINRDLGPVIEHLRGGQYNTVLVVSWGLGPEKVAYGPDGSLARFASRFPSDRARLLVNTERPDGTVLLQQAAAVACDVNAMAADHLWNNLEDVRSAKSLIGQGLLTAGAITTAIGSDRRSNTTVWVGLGLMAAGLYARATSHADTSYCDLLPQRYYVIPLNLPAEPVNLRLWVEGRPATTLVLPGLASPARGAQLRYVRLVPGWPTAPAAAPPAWAVSGRILYANDTTGVPPGLEGPSALPVVLGGRNAMAPSARALQAINHAGQLVGTTPAELADLYRQEGIRIGSDGLATNTGLDAHVLEGGRQIVSPQAGTTGFARLFCQVHPPYQPRSPAVKDLATRLAGPNTEPPGHENR